MFASTAALSLVNKRRVCLRWGATLRAAYPFNCLDDANILAAATAWVTSPTTATTDYGAPIAEWDVSCVSNMYELFAKKPTFAAFRPSQSQRQSQSHAKDAPTNAPWQILTCPSTLAPEAVVATTSGARG